MKLTIQLPITGVQFSNRFAYLDEDEQNQEGILKALTLLKMIDDTYHGNASKWADPMLEAENTQLKKGQEKQQQFMSILKHTHPDVFDATMKALES